MDKGVTFPPKYDLHYIVKFFTEASYFVSLCVLLLEVLSFYVEILDDCTVLNG